MKTKTFKCVRFQETQHWHWAPGMEPPADLRVYGVYLFCPGEATYLASLSPSSWCQFLFNEAFTNDDRFREMFDENCARDGEDHYFGFINPDASNVSVSSFDFEFDEDDPDSDGWDAAAEHFLGNYPSFNW